MRLFTCSLLFAFTLTQVIAQGDVISNFEDISVEVDSFLNGSDGSQVFQSGFADFPTIYSDAWGGYWAGGWAISNVQDSITSGFGNLYASKTNGGFDGSQNYAVGQQHSVIIPADTYFPDGMYITNTTYAYNSMRDGDTFAKKFGGNNGDDPDFFKLTIYAYEFGEIVNDSIELYLADFRFEDNSQDYIIDDWQYVDLLSLGVVDSLKFILSSSDVGDDGINTPLFFAIDNFGVTPTVHTSQVDAAIRIEVFPNPASDQIQLQFPMNASGRLQLINAQGQAIQNIQITNSNLILPIAHLPNGIYYFRWTNGSSSIMNRWIKQ